MSHPRPTSTTLILCLALIALLVPSQGRSSAIYLTAKSSSPWNGDCSAEEPICTKAAPCSINTSTKPINASTTLCEVVFLPGNYLSAPQTLTGGQNLTNLKVTFSEGTVDSLHLNITSPSLELNSTGASLLQNSVITLTMGSVNSVEMLKLDTVNTVFNFNEAGTVASNITLNITESTFVTKKQGTLLAEATGGSIFNFHRSATPSPSSSIQMILISKSAASLSLQSGLVESSLPITRIRLMATNISSARHLLSTSYPSPTNIQLLNGTHVDELLKVFDGPSISTFDSRNASSLDLHLSSISSSHLSNPSQPLGSIIDNACVDLKVAQSNISGMSIGCNNLTSTSRFHRCNFYSIYSTFLDNALCFIGAPKSTSVPKFRSTLISVRSPSPAVQTLFQGVRPNATDLELLNDGSSRRHGVFKFRGTVAFSALSKLMTNDMDIQGKVTIMTLQLRGYVHLTHGSVLDGVTELGAPRWIFRSPLSFVGDANAHEYASIIDLRHYSSLRVIVGGPVSLHREPLIKFQNGVFLSVSNALALLNSTLIDWNTNRTGGIEPAEGAVYDVFETVAAADGSENGRVATKQSSSPYSFSAWLTPKDASHKLWLASIGLLSSFPPYAVPSVASTPSNSTPAVPSILPPNSSGTPSNDELGCDGLMSYPGFACMDAQWVYSGDLAVERELVIPSLTSPIIVRGSLSLVGSSSSIRFVGESSTIRVQNCTYASKDGGKVVLDYSAGWPDSVHSWSHVTILQNEKCTTLPSKLPISVIEAPGCKTCQWTVSKSQSYALKVAFTLSKTKCLVYIGVGVGIGVAALIVIAIIGIVTYRWYAAKKRKTQHYESLLSDLD